ncbi:glycosyltransferase family 1 protein [Lujinxingia litoralis]|uniref:Glycosyltransferase family 1 protein n=1 Tax=Lujinxingia litoralis TaxID=2211119 RepID=A0A328C381_9DELT|nr:glycosyltransferase family 4 protein [Lujinxingia litoralis]RAL21263.1 glycosyltransferase family 1 protein [Lujinxingia litoralis]
MTRLLHITTVAESLGFLRTQLPAMKQRGMQIEALCSPGPHVERMSRELDIPIHTVEMPRRISPVQDLRALSDLFKTIRRLNPDIVHAHTPKGGLLGTISAFTAGTPVRIYHMRGLPLETATGWRRTLLTATERVSTTLATRTIAVGFALRQTALELNLCAPSRICVLAGGSGQGVDAEHRFNPQRFDADHRARSRAELGLSEDDFVVGFVGRLVVDKGIATLTRAFEKLHQVAPNAHLVLVGPFEERDALSPATRDALKAHPNVHLLGFQPDTAALYPLFDLLTLPTRREGFPNVLLEAAAMGLPVVASDIGPCQEAVAHEETGLIVPTDDDHALFAALNRYRLRPQLLASHGEAARQRALTRYNPSAIADDLYELYSQLLAQRA